MAVAPSIPRTCLDMTMKLDSSVEAIKQAPGPAPWYLSQPACNLSASSEPRHWQRDPKAGPAILTNNSGQTLAAITIYSYVSRISDSVFAVWKVDPKREDSSSPKVHLDLYQVDKLWPADKPINPLLMKQDGKHFLTALPPIASVQISRNDTPGRFQVHFPPEFSICEELFILVSNPGWDTAELDLWIVHPRESEIQIVPQTWFTSGSYDFGYQWVTRITRDPVTKNIVGDGIRINGFILDPTGTRFMGWLNETTTVEASSS